MGSRDTIKQLNSAREIVLRDPAIYPQVVPGVLPVIAASQPVELRRWGADFLAETFASPVVNAEDKEKMCLGILDTLKAYLTRKEDLGEEEDANVVKSATQCATSVYPLVFRHLISNGDDAGRGVWEKMMTMKSSILRRMDSAPAGVRICCIKFVARVVQVQTPSLVADPRKPDQNEISLALVSRDHDILNPSNLEAEASGLLDRLLSVLQDNTSDALIVTSTLNALSPLVHRRASISAKILSTILAFNPIKTTTTAKDKISAKSMTRTTIAFFNNVLKRMPGSPLVTRIQGQIDRLRQILTETFSDQQNGLKRGPDEPVDALYPNKRMHLDDEVETGTTRQQRADGMLPLGPVSYKDLYTLGSDPRAAGFHVEVIPQHVVAQLIPPLLQHIDQARFDQTLNIIRTRVLELQRRPPSSALDAGRRVLGGHMGMDEEDEEYDPSALGFGETDQVSPRSMVAQQSLPEEVMRLPPEPPLSEAAVVEYGEQARARLFGTLREMDDVVAKRSAEKKSVVEREKVNGFSRSAVAANRIQERDGWITLIIRLATRTSFRPREGLDDDDAAVKQEGVERSLVKQGVGGDDLPAKIRDALNRYIMDDWRRRIDVAIAWLNEEWYSDRIASKSSNQKDNTAEPSASSVETDLPTYTPLTISLLDQLVPYLDTKDGRYLIRFLSEIPYLPPEVWERIKKIAEDPERVQLITQALLYLIMLRPPVREWAIDCAVEIWRENKDARASLGKVLTKWRPQVLEEAEVEGLKEEG